MELKIELLKLMQLCQCYHCSNNLQKFLIFLLNNSVTYPHIVKNETVEPKLFDDLLNLIEQSNIKDKDKKDELIIILSNIFAVYYTRYNIGTFIDLINNKNKYFIKGLIQLINQKKINLEDLFNIERLDKMAIIDYLIMGATKNEDIEQLFNFSKTLKNTLELIDRFYDKIYIKLKSAQKEKKTGFFGTISNFFGSSNSTISINYPKFKKDDDINDIIKLQKKINEKEMQINKEKIKFINFKKIILDIIKVHTSSSLETIDSILELIKAQSKVENADDIYLVWAETLHNRAISLSKNLKMNNKELISFVKEKDIFYKNDDFKDDEKRDPNIFYSFDIYLDENENCFELFKENKIWNLFTVKSKWKLFIDIFLNKLKSIENFDLIFRLFPLEVTDSIFAEKILEKFDDKKFINANNNKIYTNLNNDLYTILKIIIKNKINAKKFTNIVEKKLILNEESINNIYLL